MKILSGECDSSGGVVQITPASGRLAYLRQDFIDDLDPNRTLREEMLTAFHEYDIITKRIESYQRKLERIENSIQETDRIFSLIKDEEKNLDTAYFRNRNVSVNKVLSQMGFSLLDPDMSVSCFSGGWKMRIGLAKLLVQEPNFLLLDEPTNHLDIDNVIWLEQFLCKQKMPMIIVSHDREFLNQVCTKIYDIENGVNVCYHGNYSA